MSGKTGMDELDFPTARKRKEQELDPDQASFFRALTDVAERARSEEPFQKHSETSRAAADAMRGEASKTLRAKVYEAIVASGDKGMTDPELQAELELTGSTQRPRRVRLVELGLVIDSGKRRDSSKGRSCTVWKATTI